MTQLSSSLPGEGRERPSCGGMLVCLASGGGAVFAIDVPGGVAHVTREVTIARRCSGGVHSCVDAHEPVAEVPRAQWQPLRTSLDEPLSRAGGVLEAYRRYGYRLDEIGDPPRPPHDDRLPLPTPARASRTGPGRNDA